MYLRGTHTYTHTHAEASCLLAYSLCLQRLSWTGLKLHSQISVQVSCMCSRDPDTWDITGCLPERILFGNWSEKGS